MTDAPTDAPVRIRPARPADAPAIARIYVETWRAAYPGILAETVLVGMDPGRQAAQWAAYLGREQEREFVCVAEDMAAGVVGFASGGPARPRIQGWKGEVYTLYVDQDHQGRGLGRALLGAAFRRLLAMGLEPAVLWVLEKNPARFFYEAMGGEQVGRRTDRLGGEPHDELAYGWSDLATACRAGGP